MKRSLIFSLALALAACGDAPSDLLQGYGEAEYIYLASQEAGVLGELLVREGDTVAQGDQVFRLDPDRLSLTAQSAESRRAAAASAVLTAQAEATLAQRNYARGAELAERGFYPRAQLDADRAARDAANARLAQARREAAAAGRNRPSARTAAGSRRPAPQAGTIERIYRRPGEVIAAGQPIAALLPPQNMKVRFFAPQDMLARLRVGARVLVSCDGEGCEEPIPATVSYVAAEPQFTPPVIYSLEEREKLVFLVEARFEGATPIRPGMPVDVRIAE
ncbi:MAG: HlyD family efflux transporter periplasmic adaptor subunit [Hyphomonadaceae bacterium]